MNKEYILVNDKAVVSDEKGVLKPVIYTDKTNEIFIKENFIEYMEADLVDIKDSIKRLDNNNKEPKKKMMIHSILATAATFVVPMLVVMSCNVEITALKLLNMAVVAGCAGVAVLLGEYLAVRYLEKYKNSCLFRKGYLESQIISENEKLKQLQASASKVDINKNIDLTPIKVDHQPELSKLRHQLEIYHYLGDNLKKLIKLQNRGQLTTQLKEDYTDQEIAIINEQIKNYQLQKSSSKN